MRSRTFPSFMLGVLLLLVTACGGSAPALPQSTKPAVTGLPLLHPPVERSCPCQRHTPRQAGIFSSSSQMCLSLPPVQ